LLIPVVGIEGMCGIIGTHELFYQILLRRLRFTAVLKSDLDNFRASFFLLAHLGDRLRSSLASRTARAAGPPFTAPRSLRGQALKIGLKGIQPVE
jgi:hypothetical protein